MLLSGGRGNDCRIPFCISLIRRDREDNGAVVDAARLQSHTWSKVRISRAGTAATGATAGSLASGLPEPLAHSYHPIINAVPLS